MVIKIYQVASTENALMYNEKKVKQGIAIFFDCRNTLSVNPFMFDEKHRLKNLLNIEKLNPRVKNKCLHISFNPSTEDYLKLGDTTIQKEIRNMMEFMGYGNQPYFVYKHKDLERVHFHIVSTRIDRETGRKIKDNHERRKMQKFVYALEQKFQLFQTGNKEIPDFKFSPRSKNIKQNLENLFAHLNQVKEITSEEIYNQALKLFHVEIRKFGRGHIVVVIDGEGNPIRYPIRLSNFKEKPRFYLAEKKELRQQKEQKHENISTQQKNNRLSPSLIWYLIKMIRSENPNDSKTRQKLYKRKRGKQIRY